MAQPFRLVKYYNLPSFIAFFCNDPQDHLSSSFSQDNIPEKVDQLQRHVSN